MSVTISAEQREALYDQILIRLSGIGDVWLVVEAKDFDAADRLGREYCDDLRLVLDDLRWGEGTGSSVELTSPPDVLRRVFRRMFELAETQLASEEEERLEIRRNEERNRRLLEMCRRVLSDLGEGPEGT